MSETLLQKAEKIPHRQTKNRNFSREELEVVVAFLHSKISIIQACTVLGGIAQGSLYTLCTTALRHGITNGTVEVTLKQPGPPSGRLMPDVGRGTQRSVAR